MVCTVLAGLKWEHCTHLTWNMGHRMKWDHYKHPLSYHFVLCWGWSFLIRLYLWVSICSPKGSVCLRFVQCCLNRTSETIAGISLEKWVTDWSETTTSIPYYITVCLLGDVFSLYHLRWVPRSPPTKHKVMWLDVLVVVSLHPVTQISSKVCAVVSLVLPRQNCTKHRRYPQTWSNAKRSPRQSTKWFGKGCLWWSHFILWPRFQVRCVQWSHLFCHTKTLKTTDKLTP